MTVEHGMRHSSKPSNAGRLAWLGIVINVALIFGFLPAQAAESRDRSSASAEGQSPVVRIEVRGLASEALSGQRSGSPDGALQREFVDPCVGTRWRLVTDARHPEWPGRLVPIDSGKRQTKASGGRLPFENRNPAAVADAPAALSPSIRAGDRVTVSQETEILRARFQAVALEPAAVGQTLRVRLLGGTDILNGGLGTVLVVRASSAQEVTWLPAEAKRP